MGNKDRNNIEKDPGKKLGVYVATAVITLIVLSAAVYFIKGSFNSEKKNIDDILEPYLVESLQEARAQLNILPGAKVCAGDPRLAGYWSGDHVQMANTLEGLKEQVEAGLCDYAVIDSLWVRRHARQMKMLVTGVQNLPGAGLVYRKYFQNENMLIGIHKRGADPLHIDPEISTSNEAAYLVSAAEAMSKGYVEHARQLYVALAKAAPNHRVYHHELVKIYIVYGYFDGVSLDRAEDELMKYAFLSPGAGIKNYSEAIQTIRTLHQAQWGSQ